MREPLHSRRAFLEGGGAVVGAAGLGAGRAAGGSVETLALEGGPKAVTVPAERHREASRWPRFGAEEERAVLDVLHDPGYSQLAALEGDWREAFQVPYARTFCNGTSAIASMLFALDLPPGSEILVPSYTFFATIVPMRMFGLVPAFVDIDPHTLNIDVEDAGRRLTTNTKAIFPVHWFGLPCDMDDIASFADRHGLIVIEDVAHAHGASLKGKLLGNWGRMAIFSFQASKPLPAIEGGMGVYQGREDFERASTFGHYDAPAQFPEDSPYRKYFGTGLGAKYRMHPMAAALVRSQLPRLRRRNAEGAAQVRRLNERLTQLPGLSDQRTRPDADRIYYSSNMLFLDEAKAGVTRAAVVKALQAEGVRASAYSYRLQHKCALYHEAKWWHHAPAIPDLPGSDEANRTGIGLPYFTEDVPELVEQYALAFEKVWAHRKELGTA